MRVLTRRVPFAFCCPLATSISRTRANYVTTRDERMMTCFDCGSLLIMMEREREKMRNDG